MSGTTSSRFSKEDHLTENSCFQAIIVCDPDVSLLNVSNFKLPKKCELCELNANLDESTILRGGGLKMSVRVKTWGGEW